MQDHPFVPFPEGATEGSIPIRFEEQAEAYADKVAVRAEGKSLSYRALNQAANRLARAILRLDLGREGPVALLLEHGVPAITAILGVLKTGRTYVAMDASYPQAWLLSILADSQASLIVTNGQSCSIAREVGEPGIRVLNIDELDADVSAEDLDLTPISPDTVAVLFYTSGSTGRPKGVPRTHRQILFQLVAHTSDLRINASDCQTQFKSCSFGGSVTDIYGALLNGATLCMYDVRRHGLAPLADWLVEQRITLFTPPVPMFRQFVDSLADGERLPHIRVVKLGGQAIYRKDVESFRRHFSPECLLVHRLSSSEAGTIGQIIIDLQTVITGDVVPAGYAPTGKEVFILDEDGARLGFDRVGEIAVKSRYLAPGYWRRPDLTDRVFLPIPEGGEARIYLTGDLGVMRPDGCLEWLGRKDSQVKIRGYRVEISQVESALQSVDGIRDTVVVAQDDEHGEKRLVAYFVPAEGKVLSASVVRNSVAQKLPSYMVPSVFLVIDSFPLTRTGKVDVSALPPVGRTRPDVDQPYLAPRTELEATLAEIWAQVLSINLVGMRDSLVDLGGDSLTATQIVSRVQRSLHVDLPLRALFDSPTVADVASLIEQHMTLASDQERLTATLVDL